jgi:hypothetical protein
MRPPKFTDLIPAQQAHFGNGLGPYWLPDRARRFITSQMSWFFADASWRHHDFGYAVGGDRWDRARCDRKFLAAMWRDALSQERLIAVPLALMLALTFYIAVRIGGQFGSFVCRDGYADMDEILATYGSVHWVGMRGMEPAWYQARLASGKVDLRQSWDEAEWLLWEEDRGPDTPLLFKTGEPDLARAIPLVEAWLRKEAYVLGALDG